VLGAACHISLQGFILPILQHTEQQPREREKERDLMSWSSRHPISIDCWSKWVMITRLNCCSRWDRCIIVVLASHVTQLHNFKKNKERERENLHLGYNETNCGCSDHTVSGEERTYCLRKWCKCEGINEVTIMTPLANYATDEYLH